MSRASSVVLIAICLANCGCQPQATRVNSDVSNRQIYREGDLETALFKLSDDELFDIGVTATDVGLWSIAWSTDSAEDSAAINNALASVGLSALGSFNHGRGGWYIEKADFFVAQAALKQDRDVRRLEISIVEPQLDSLTNNKNDEP